MTYVTNNRRYNNKWYIREFLYTIYRNRLHRKHSKHFKIYAFSDYVCDLTLTNANN